MSYLIREELGSTLTARQQTTMLLYTARRWTLDVFDPPTTGRQRGYSMLRWGIIYWYLIPEMNTGSPAIPT